MRRIWRRKDGYRHCNVCKRDVELNILNFYRNSSKADGWSTECRPCHKRRSQERRSARRAAFILDKGNTCNHCSVYHKDHMFFDLDHIVPLRDHGAVRRLREYDKDKLQVLCPNCHRIKTMNEMNWGKYEKS